MTAMQERVESILAAPPVGAASLLILGYPLSDVVIWLNLIYISILIGHKLFRIYKDYKKGVNDGCTY